LFAYTVTLAGERAEAEAAGRGVRAVGPRVGGNGADTEASRPTDDRATTEPMKPNSSTRHGRGRLVPVAVVAVTLVLTVVALVALVPAPAAAQTASPSATCAGSEAGAIYLADTGLTVEESDPGVLFGTPGTDTVDFQSIQFASAGPASVRLENGTGDVNCLAALNASANDLTVTADGEGSFVFSGRVDVVSFRAPVYAGSSAVDMAYDAPGAFTVQVPADGLPQGTAVQAVTPSGTVLDDTTVDSEGTATFDLPAGTEEVRFTIAPPDDPNSPCGGATDTDRDGLYEDVDGDGTFNFFDVLTLYDCFQSDTEPSTPPFDFDGDGTFNFFDVLTLYDEFRGS
jgi:hypothetical protein